MSVACAIDFGTSNSTLALVKDGVVRQLAVDPHHREPTLMPTLLYFQAGKAPLYGARAIAAYLENELEGRLIQSIKRHLPASSFDGTSLGRSTVTLETLIAGFLRHLRLIAEEAAGEPVTAVLLGRPARFHVEPERDALAEERLRRAAALAGFTRVELQVEPVAAARSFEQALDRDVLCFVGDLGGGTSDFSVIRLGPGRVGRGPRTADVLGVSGVPVAGNDVDARMVWGHVVPHFGVNARYQPAGRWVEVPDTLHHAMTRWHTLCQATTPQNLLFIDRMIRSADDKAGLGRLKELIAGNYGYLLFRSVERAKIALSEADDTVLSFHRGDIELDTPVARVPFEASLAPELDPIRRSALGLLDQIGLRPSDIDVAFLTGGTSQLPVVRRQFREWFEDRIVEQDAFTSVGWGLGVEAAERFV